MPISTINISLPDTLKGEVEDIVAKDGYGNVSEFFRTLVRKHLEEREEKRLEILLLAGLESGSATPLTKADLNSIKEAAKERIAARRKTSR